MRTWNSLLERGLYQAGRIKIWEVEAPDVVRILRSRADLADVLEARARGVETVGALIGAEGAHILEGKLENLDLLWDARFRLMGLHHFLDSELGGSLHGESTAGLSPYGHEVVAELVKKGFIINLTHSSLTTARDVLAMTAMCRWWSAIPKRNQSRIGGRQFANAAKLGAPGAGNFFSRNILERVSIGIDGDRGQLGP